MIPFAQAADNLQLKEDRDAAMPTQDYWAQPPMTREQIVLFAPTLDNMIGEDETVRLIDEVLRQRDWSIWEAHYDGTCGQPPIHPRVLASAILYGLCRSIRSSRRLEYACRYNLDFIWLVEGRSIDHTTFAKFRTEFKSELKDLFRQLGRVALSVGLVRLGEVGFDGTRVKANNSRYATRTAATLQENLTELDEQIEQLMAEVETADAVDAQLFGSDDSATKLPPELADAKQRREQLRKALERARAADAARKRDGTDPEKNPAQVPTTDPDSRVMPNKEGGYAPNYTPTVATDGERGFIVDADVTAEVNEQTQTLATLDRIEETFGQQPEKLLADSAHATGAIMEGCEKRHVELHVPVDSNEPQLGNPANRADATQPVPESAWPQLPRNSHGQLDRSCFLYDAAADQFYCPMGHAMPYEQTKTDMRGGQLVPIRVYRCNACSGCPLASACLSATTKRGRTITRDPYEEVRARTAARMATESARELYDQRPRIAETPFGILKAVMGLRQFLLRGLDKIKTEWLWACTAFNLVKLARELARLRAWFAELSTECMQSASVIAD
jgi:transposase